MVDRSLSYPRGDNRIKIPEPTSNRTFTIVTSPDKYLGLGIQLGSGLVTLMLF